MNNSSLYKLVSRLYIKIPFLNYRFDSNEKIQDLRKEIEGEIENKGLHELNSEIKNMDEVKGNDIENFLKLIEIEISEEEIEKKYLELKIDLMK